MSDGRRDAGVRAPVAVIGIGCRFPGGIVDAASFWDALVERRDAISEIPADRIDVQHFYDPAPATPGRMMTHRGGFLGPLDAFDADFFGIAPLEAERLDPQQRLLLETAWEALEDAGVDVAALEGSRTGVYVGQWASDFESRLFADPEAVDFYMTTGSGRYAVSGRLSYQLGLRGPSMTIDTACSSSLVAVHTAVRSLRTGESELALAGGVNIILQPQITIAYSQSRMMAPDGRCKFGDVTGDGYVRSEGVGLVVLKPLESALADGDRIYAVIRGSAVNNDGRSSGMMGRPSRLAQEEVLRAAYRDAGLAPGEVGYVEAHGTGTRAGDPVELGALGTVLGEERLADRPAWVGSVKTNIGHTEGAAGIAGLIKASLCIQHGAIPASLHFGEPNPNVNWADAPLRIPREQVPWPAGATRRVAGVSGYGISGTNAHVVLEGAPQQAHGEPMANAQPALDRAGYALNLSARSPEALRSLARRYHELLLGEDEDDRSAGLGQLCAAAATHRTMLSHRASFLGTNGDEIKAALQAYASGAQATFEAHSAEPPRVVFVVPGQGAQWTGMGRELLEREPVFAEALRRCDAAARPFIDWSIVEQLGLEPATPGYRLDQIDVIQPVLVAMAIAYAELLGSFGVRPHAVIGHSLGEVGAACLAGVLSLEQAMRVICRRSALMKAASGRGAMAVVELPLAEAAQRLAGLESRIAVAVNNSPRSCVVSGDPDAVEQLLGECEREGNFCRRIKVDVASHGPQMDEPSAALAAELADLVPAEARLPIVSTVLGGSAGGAEFDAAYWARNLRQPVRFAAGIDALLDEGASVFVELGPHPLLLQAIQENAQARGAAVTAIACGRRDEPEQRSVLSLLAGVWCAGQPVAWREWFTSAPHLRLPSYPWQRQRYWAPEAAAFRGGGTGSRPKSLAAEQRAWLHQLRWRAQAPTELAELPGRDGRGWLVAGPTGDDALGGAIVSAMSASGVEADLVPVSNLGEMLGQCGAQAPAGVVLVLPAGSGAAFVPIAALQAVAHCFAGRDDAPKLWVVTRGAQAVEGEARSVDLDQAAAWGACRVIAEEHPGLWGGLVDLDPQALPEASGQHLLATLRSRDGEDQVAYRGDDRFILRLEPFAGIASLGAPCDWRSDGAYLVTGGLGGLGLQVATEMVRQGARRLVLMGRRGLPPRNAWSDADPVSPVGRRIAAVRALERAGASVHVLEADVAEAAALEGALEQYAAESWPPIVGVVHAAGVMEKGLSLQLDAAAFDAVMAPKLAGARNLDRLFPDVERFVLFSSISGVLGLAGTANYAAANVALDAIAASRRQRGAHGLSIQWGAWHDIGMHASELAQRSDEDLLRRGIQTIPPAQGAALFGALLCADVAALAVMPVDWARFAAACRGRVRPMLRECARDVAGGSDGSGDFAARLAAMANPEQRQRLLQGAVRETVARVLRIPPQRIDPRRVLGTLGLDSLMALELRNQLEVLIGRALSATLTWNYPTVEALASYLAASSGGGSGAPSGPAEQSAAITGDAIPESAAADPLANIGELSDKDIAEQLRGARRTRR